jgi:hypothetical protein
VRCERTSYPDIVNDASTPRRCALCSAGGTSSRFDTHSCGDRFLTPANHQLSLVAGSPLTFLNAGLRMGKAPPNFRNGVIFKVLAECNTLARDLSGSPAPALQTHKAAERANGGIPRLFRCWSPVDGCEQ